MRRCSSLASFLRRRAVRSTALGLGLVAGFGVVPRSVRAQTAPVPVIDTHDRAQVVDLYRHDYLPSGHVLPGWTGNLNAGTPGTVNPEYLRAVLRRINYFRSMSGLPNVVFDDAYNARCQQAALMMAAAGMVSHAPPASWKFYTRLAALTAAHSNLNLNWHGDQGPGAIDRYMDDPGPHNGSVGHRRWLLCPVTRIMGTGIIPGEGTVHPGTNVTWITDGAPRLPAPEDDDRPVPASVPPANSWPPPGFVPAPLVFERWSFALLNADFRRAVVHVSKEGPGALAVVQERLEYQSAADGSGPYLGVNTLVWTLPGNVVSPTAEETYRVQVTNVRVAGRTRDFAYTVTSIDPVRRERLNASPGEDGERLAGDPTWVR